MSIQPRHYQTAAVSACLDAAERRVGQMLYTMPTGCGKTVTFTLMLEALRQRGFFPAVVIAHREELLEQAANTIRGYDDMLRVEIEQADRYAPLSSDVIIASVQTLINPKRLERIKAIKPKVIICDEAHHANAASYRKVFDVLGCYTGQCLLIGCTATAKRGDKQGLVQDGTPKFANCPFAEMVHEYPIIQAVEEGYLCPVRGYVVRTDIDLTGIRKVAGDFNQGELNNAVNKDRRTLLAIDKWEEVAQDRRTLVFCTSVDHATRAARKWRERGYNFEVVWGEMDKDERRAVLHRFKQGITQGVCNMGVLTEGFDEPRTDCIVHLRPTKNWGLYVQMTGRGLRLAGGKDDCIILDVVDITKDKNLATAPAILDLPPNLDLQGNSLKQTHQMMKQYSMRLGRIATEQPTTYEQLRGILEAVDLLDRASGTAGVRASGNWQAVSPTHYRLPTSQYRSIEIIFRGDKWHIELHTAQGVTHGPTWGKNAIKERMFQAAEAFARSQWQRPAEQRGEPATGKQQGMLRFLGVPRDEIRYMTKQEASKRIQELARK